MIFIIFDDENGKRDEVERNVYIYWSDEKRQRIKVIDVRHVEIRGLPEL